MSTYAKLYVATVALAVSSATGAAEAASTPVTACGQTVAQGRAHLAADLDCSGFDGAAISLGRARLNLNGFTLTGSALTPGDGTATVVCAERCDVRGPGTIQGGDIGIAHSGPFGAVLVRDLTVRDALGAGIVGPNVKVRGADIHGNGLLTGGCGVVVGDGRLKMQDSSVHENGCGIDSLGTSTHSVVAVKRSQIISNLWLSSAGVLFGIRGGNVRVSDSSVSSNVRQLPPYGGRCGPEACGDIVTHGEPPRLKNVACEISVDGSVSPPVGWGLCPKDGDFDSVFPENASDACPYHPMCWTDGADADGWDYCCDNCPDVHNPDQADADGDGIGDACEI